MEWDGQGVVSTVEKILPKDPWVLTNHGGMDEGITLGGDFTGGLPILGE